MRIGVLGGTFNPPHNGHINAVNSAREQLRLDKVILVPAHIPPHKILPEKTATDNQRFEMTELIAREIGADVSDIEYKREGKSYTADTIEEIKRLYPSDEIWFIMGTDMFLNVANWYQPERIFKNARLAVVAREEDGREKLYEHKEKLMREFEVGIDIINTKAVEISSTVLRNDPESQDLPESIREYIRINRLY